MSSLAYSLSCSSPISATRLSPRTWRSLRRCLLARRLSPRLELGLLAKFHRVTLRAWRRRKIASLS